MRHGCSVGSCPLPGDAPGVTSWPDGRAFPAPMPACSLPWTPKSFGGYRVFTGERVTSGGGARHILGEEALRALAVLEQADHSGRGGQTLRREAIARASAFMVQRLIQHEGRPRGKGTGFYCCRRCSVALWRTLAVGGLDRAEERLSSGVCGLRQHRDGLGAWRGFPFAYTLSALHEIHTDEAEAELRYARPAIERRLSRAHRPGDTYAARRFALAHQVLARLG
ncbi:MAG: hypothetical protein CO096_25485 [Armatimonadetes bacterium CG_4_9_14_3_um_filter_66_14]|nr:MAG: hypothetical protein CO096_25485 [Armatimonadetes bacterium CG_4_9_14_3_um_filter_66_14]